VVLDVLAEHAAFVFVLVQIFLF